MLLKNTLTSIFAFLLFNLTQAQQCPGGGTLFSSAVMFDQAWISGCLTGTSCNGGVEFDNRASCEPTTAIDACASSPSCTTATNGSDIWFKFYASSTTATIKAIQNVSFIATVQAFSGGPTCGSLTEIGCAIAGGPSSGVALSLSGLTPNALYYFRIFGSSNPAAQRTGTYCFCGSVGLNSSSLPVILTSFTANSQLNKIRLSWNTASELNCKYFEVQRSIDGNNFESIGIVNAQGTSAISSDYTFIDNNPYVGTNLYRLKQIEIDNKVTYSKTTVARIYFGNALSIVANVANENVIVRSSMNIQGKILNSQGQTIRSVNFINGLNEILASSLPSGIYFIKFDKNQILKFSINK